jgi:hypothetical protein
MLDWHERPLCVAASECTTSLGHAAIQAQNPEYVRRPPTHVYTGKAYAEEYLLPLAKTDLLFDDIHFLSPVIDVSRIHLHPKDNVSMQERCNDEFRIVVAGRHRGTWTSRADIVLDCRGAAQQAIGMGPGGGLAIGESDLRESFLKHTPLDRKFEQRSLAGKRVCLVGQSLRATQFALEFVQQFSNQADTRLIWIIRCDRQFDTEACREAIRTLRDAQLSNVVLQEALGVDQIRRQGGEEFALNLLNDDDSTVEIHCDAVCSFTDGIATRLSPSLDGDLIEERGSAPFVTKEPGLYVLRAADIADGAGGGLVKAFENIRRLFALIAGRENLDLYQIIDQQCTKQG